MKPNHPETYEPALPPAKPDPRPWMRSMNCMAFWRMEVEELDPTDGAEVEAAAAACESDVVRRLRPHPQPIVTGPAMSPSASGVSAACTVAADTQLLLV